MSEEKEESTFIVGGSLEENAYHEAGHIVAAVVGGLALKPKGILIYGITPTVTDGYAVYWYSFDDSIKREPSMVALLAGVNAQFKKFGVTDGKEDLDKHYKLLDEYYKYDRNAIGDRLYARVLQVLDDHWDAVIAIASEVIKIPWLPVPSGEYSKACGKKQLDGQTIAVILARFGINARVE